MHNDATLASKELNQYSTYANKEGLFANNHVWEMAKGQSSWKWWQKWKGPFPELAKVAMRVFSQVTGAGAGERNWSTYGFVVSTLRSRLLPDRARRLVYVHYNLRAVNRVLAMDYEEKFFEWVDDVAQDSDF